MPEILRQHIQRLIKIDQEFYDKIIPCFTTIHVKKKQNLLLEGKICHANYFVVKGCLRMFFVNEKGVEQTTEFALENWWLSDYASYASQQPSEFFIQAVENSEIMALEYTTQQEMLALFPQMEKYFRLVHQRAHSAYQSRIKFLYHLSREEMYKQFIAAYPEFVQRIPQYLLASFLGFTPEYLSELRRKKIS